MYNDNEVFKQMEVGIIAPIKLLNEYCITRTQYCIPSLLENKDYLEFYKTKNNVILDCKKLGWKREPELLSTIVQAVQDIYPSLIICPSEMYNSRKTLEVTKYTLNTLEMLSKASLVPCLEGTSEEEIKSLEEEYTNMGFNLIAIPSHIYRYYKGEGCREYIYIDNHSKPDELIGRQGILVSSLPVRLGLAGRLLSQSIPTPPSLSFKEEEDEFPMITKRNVADFIEMYEED